MTFDERQLLMENVISCKTMFPSGGIHVDQDRRKKAGLLPWAGRGPGAARQSI